MNQKRIMSDRTHELVYSTHFSFLLSIPIQQQLSHLSQIFGIGYMNQKRITPDRAQILWMRQTLQDYGVQFNTTNIYVIILVQLTYPKI